MSGLVKQRKGLVSVLFLVLMLNVCFAQSFEDFLVNHKRQILGENLKDSLNVIVVKQKANCTLIGSGEKSINDNTYGVVNIDSIFTVQQAPFLIRINSYYGNKKVSCIATESSKTYLSNSFTEYERQELSKLKRHQKSLKVEGYFFNPIIGWKGLSGTMPTMNGDTIYEGIECYKIRQQASNKGYYEHLVNKSNLQVIVSYRFRNDKIVCATFFDDYRKVQGVFYPFKTIEEVHTISKIGRTEYTVEYVVFNPVKNLPKGVFDCSLNAKDVRSLFNIK